MTQPQDALEYPEFHRGVQYSQDSSLNTLQTCILSSKPSDPSKIWVIYVHGGAWRDPEIDAASFDALQELLVNNACSKYINGLASINYRLSPYPSHSTDASNPADPSRNAKHPDHINDVLAAILFLQEKYNFEDKYVLIGHSCGATLALQVAMKRYWGMQYESTYASELNVVPPLAIVGVEGIYDVPMMLERYKDIPAYQDFVVSAFGNNAEVWRAVSPAYADFRESWQDGVRVVLIHSKADELLGIEQRERMAAVLLEQGWESSGQRRLTVADIDDQKHDEVWQYPEQLVGIISDAIIQVAAPLA